MTEDRRRKTEDRRQKTEESRKKEQDTRLAWVCGFMFVVTLDPKQWDVAQKGPTVVVTFSLEMPLKSSGHIAYTTRKRYFGI